MSQLSQFQLIFPIIPEEEESFLQALTHTSWANENGDRSEANERLEFIGDAVLGFVIAEHLFLAFPDFPEGDLTRLKSELVREPALAEISRALGLPALIRLGQGARAEGLSERPSVQADSVEAVIGWIATNRGLPEAREWIVSWWQELLAKINPEHNTDFKGLLQEYVQKAHGELPIYRLVSSHGPDHDKSFEVEVLFSGTVKAKGTGKSKKVAEQMAAQHALELFSRE